MKIFSSSLTSSRCPQNDIDVRVRNEALDQTDIGGQNHPFFLFETGLVDVLRGQLTKEISSRFERFR
jgi:hypothetical protein